MSKKEDLKDIKKFSLTIGIIFIFIGILLFFNEKSIYLYFIIIPILFILIGHIVPLSIKPIFRIWMFLAFILGLIMTRVNLGLVYFVILTPIAIIARFFGNKYLKITFDKKSSTYWNYEVNTRDDKNRYEKQF